MAIIRLSSRLNPFAVPLLMPNGNPVKPWTDDQYLNNPARWSLQSPLVLKNNGISRAFGQAGSFVMYQDTNISTMNYNTTYVEIEKINGAFYFNQNGADSITEPGVYIITAANSVVNTTLHWAGSYFTVDPYFKNIPVGGLPTSGTEGFQNYTGQLIASKNADGRIYIDCTGAGLTGGLRYSAAWLPAADVDIEFVVDYIPPGTTLKLWYGNATQMSGISSPGRYTVMVRGATTTLSAIIQHEVQVASGSAIISYFNIKAAGQTWQCEGSHFIQMSAWFSAQSAYFDKIINPSILCLANEFSHKPANSPYPTDPQLGFGAYVPPAGPANIGDTIRNAAWVSGQPVGWRCIASGNPGTWMPLASL